MTDGKAIVIDNGSDLLKAGIAGEEEPSVSFATVVGRPRAQSAASKNKMDDTTYVGVETARDLSIKRPIERGVVTNWDDMERVWQHVFDELHVSSPEHHVLLTEVALNPKPNREKMAELMFESFHVPGVYVSTQAVLSLYAYGHTTGVVLESGDGATQVMSIYEGYCLPKAAQRYDVGGYDLSMYMMKLLNKRGLSLQVESLAVCRGIKERYCNVAMDPATHSNAPVDYQLPDGRTVSLGAEQSMCPEALFNPSVMGASIPALHDAIYASVQACAMDIRKELFANVVISGGNTLFSGLPERLQKELTSLVPPAIKVKINAPAERGNYVWMGGSVLASLGKFKSMCVSKADYDEKGAAIIHTKCF